MKILHLESESNLARYTVQQMKNLMPFPVSDDLGRVEPMLPEALRRLEHCIANVRVWTAGVFDPLHSTQYCLYLYFLANTIWRANGERETPTKLFCLNKALNGIDLFYELDMPEIFFIGHSVGIVLAKATYANYLVLYQNSTVGKNHGVAPVLESGVVMYPNTAIIGRCNVRAGTVLAQGTSVVNKDTPGNCYAFPGTNGSLSFTPLKRDILKDIFRL